MSDTTSVLKEQADIPLRRAEKDRRKQDMPFEGPDRRKGPSGYVIEVHQDESGRPRTVLKRKKQLDRRRPASVFDHQL